MALRYSGEGRSATHVRDPDVVVGQQVLPAEHRVGAAGVELVGPQVAGLERQVRRPGAGRRGELLGGHDRGRRVPVVEQGRVGGEALLAHQLLGVEAAVGLPELGVALAGHLADAAVVRHRRLPICPVHRPMASDNRTLLSVPRSVPYILVPCQRRCPALLARPRRRRRRLPAGQRRRCPTPSPPTADTAPPGTPTWSARCWCPPRRWPPELTGLRRPGRGPGGRRDRRHRRSASLPVALPCLAADGVTVRQVEAAVAKRGEDPQPGLAELLRLADAADRACETVYAESR